ncbi:hypothetical protein H2201_005477 [Coniosporium apollinis]|uniref:DUF7962 domain-containing protein n=1 Tax=Coniosporium apollinis TaxID=61459 RepID=A0ABQ9NSU8_9PEZI|nr:hypothetical protein H2201_005477 [Coniosporium apollinis]
MSIGRDVYCDTRLMIQKLEELYPQGTLSERSPEGKGIQGLLETWTNDQFFWHVARLLPPTYPMIDKAWREDRADMAGDKLSAEAPDEARREALGHIVAALDMLEHTFFADGRDWILKTKNPTLADINGIWTWDWLFHDSWMEGAIPDEYALDVRFPKVFAWTERFRQLLRETEAPVTWMDSNDVVEAILSSEFAEPEGTVDPTDPLGLQKGQEIEVWPTDSGMNHHDHGFLVKLDIREVAISAKSKDGRELRIHFPRTNFRISAISELAN